MTLGSPFMPISVASRARQCVGGRDQVKSGDDAEVRTLPALLVDQLLRIIEAASAHRLAAHRRIGRLGRARALAGSLANFILTDDVAGTDNHGRNIKLM